MLPGNTGKGEHMKAANPKGFFNQCVTGNTGEGGKYECDLQIQSGFLIGVLLEQFELTTRIF